MQKKYVKYNVLMALAILFAICYQSLHIFTESKHHHHQVEKQEDHLKLQIAQDNQDDCPVCEFHFAAFLTSSIYVLGTFSPIHKFHFSDTYQSIVKEKEFLYFSHRGPPLV
jgi:hypothetical protein